MQNYIQEGKYLSVACSNPATVTSGSPVRVGSLTGVAATAEGDGGNAATEATVQFGQGVFDLSVVDSGGAGIAIGDKLYFHDGAPPTIDNVGAGGFFFGYAVEAVGAGLTATINVLHVISPGGEEIVAASGAVSAQAATATLTAAIAGKNVTNTGASGAIVLTLPAASALANQAFRVAVLVAQTITLTPASGEKIYLNGSGVASKYLLIAGVIGNFVNVWCDGVSYHVRGYSGVVTKEA
ncbi:MAG: DUF2190 family protein [Bryobacteraceae bacterium]